MRTQLDRGEFFLVAALAGWACCVFPRAAAAQPPVAGYVLVAERATNTVVKIDWSTDEAVARAVVGNVPSTLAVDVSNRWVYVTLNGDNSIAVIKPDSMEVARLRVSGAGRAPIGAALTPDGQRLLVATRGADGIPSPDDCLDVIQLNTSTWPPVGSLITKVFTGLHPINVVVGHDGRQAVVSARNQPAILIIDLQTYQIVGQAPNLPAGSEPEGIDIHPEANIVYVTLHGTNSAIQVIDLATLSFLSRVPIVHSPPAQPSGGRFTPDGALFYVSAQAINKVLLFNTSDPFNPVQEMSVELPVGPQPHDIVFLPRNKAYVADTNNQQPKGDLSVLDNYTGTPSIAGQILTNLGGPISCAYFLPQPEISGITYDTNTQVTVETGEGLTYRLWSSDDDLAASPTWSLVSEQSVPTNGLTIFTDFGQNGRPAPSEVKRRFYRASVYWNYNFTNGTAARAGLSPQRQ